MALHTVNLLPGDDATPAALAQLRDGDAVLFHGEGAWHAAAPALDAWARTGVTRACRGWASGLREWSRLIAVPR